MSTTHGHTLEIKNPGSFATPSGLKTLLIAMAVLGGIVWAVALKADPTRAWTSFLMNHVYFLCLALGGLFFPATQYLTGAMWSVPVRRICEAFTSYLPVALIGLVILFFGMHTLYHWTHADVVAADPILNGKKAYLNIPFFFIRNGVFFAIWIFFAKKMVGNSIAQDQSGDVALTTKNIRMSPPLLILFGFSLTYMAFDLLMSLDPHWFSTMYGVYVFAGLFYTTLATLMLLVIYLRRNGILAGVVNVNHIHDIGKFMFAFTVFWAYIAFSQFMLIWYANMPEETGYFIKRMSTGWMPVTVFLLVGKFLVPFFGLITRDSKRNENRLLFVAAFMLVAHWIDLMWLVQPEFYKEGPKVGWIEIGTTLGFVGLFGSMVFRFLAKNNVVAIRDPKLPASQHHHQ